MLIIDWRVFIIVIAVFIVCVALTKIVSLSSLAAATAGPISVMLLKGIPLPYELLAFFAAAIVWINHRENIKRLLNGTEKKFKPGKGRSKQ